MTRWADIPDEPGYQVSDDGQVRSIPRRLSDGRWWPGKVLSQATTNGGYKLVCINGHTKTVHRLVLEAFVGPRPPGQECRHSNGPGDNRLSQLRWGTSTDNKNDTVADGNHHYARRDRCKNGHPYTPENTRMRGSGRVCRQCQREAQDRFKSARLS